MKSSWCDKLASTPIAGFTLTPDYVSAGTLMDAFAPLLNKLAARDVPRFTVEQGQNFAFTYTTQDGFQTAIEPNKVVVSFVYRLKARATSAGPPIVEMLSQARPYTELLPIVLEKLVEAASLLPNVRKREVRRVGVVAAARVAEDEAPPGIQRFIQYVSLPWHNSADSYAFNIASELSTSSTHSDRCVHNVSRGEGEDELLNLSFDWQRNFIHRRPTNTDTLREIASDAEKAALAYFEDLAEGDRFDREVINSKS